MKTAVSVPDAVFQAGERLARNQGISRSQLYAEALRAYVAQHDDDEVTRRLNEVYGSAPAELDPVMTRIAARALPKESWK
jgi:metal-responsive CopG/Arc/MetJ family transcriptional regulator